MRLLHFLVDAFINGFGITQPTPEKRKQVTLILGSFFLLIIAFVCAVSAFFLWQLHGVR